MVASLLSRARSLALARPNRTFASEYNRSTNSFTALRLLFAVAVIYSHSYAISGVSWRDQLEKATGVTTGHLAVVAFFVISGFLVTQSLSNPRPAHRLATYALNRVLRIMPGLVVCTIVIAFVVGPFFGHRTLEVYYSTAGGWSPWWYSFDTLTFNLFSDFLGWHPRLRDAFASNPMTAVVNGSLWSLRFEIGVYVVLGLGAWLCRYRMRLLTGILAVAGLAAVVLFRMGARELPFHALWVFREWDVFLSVAPYFFIGAAIYVFRDRVPYSPSIAGLLAAVALLASATTLREIVWVVAVPYLVLMAGVSKNVSWFDRFFGDYSYGTYIYAFPIQQIVVTVLAIDQPYLLFAIATPITLAVAFISWHLVEHPALRLKQRLGKAAQQPATLPSAA